MEQYTIKVKVDGNEAVSELQDIEKEVKDIKTESSQLTGTLDGLTGGAITKFNTFKGSLRGVTAGFKTLRGAIIATGIGALIIAITSLTASFASNEEGQNKLNKITTKISVVFGNLTDILATVGEGFWALGEAIGNFITGDFAAAGAAFDEFKGKVNATADAVANFAAETAAEMKIAGQVADLRAAADKQERELIVERGKANAKIIELRTKNEQKDKFSAQERIAFLQQAMSIESELANKEIDLANKRLTARQLENTLAGSTKDDLMEEAQLERQLLDLKFASDTRNKELVAQVRATNDEIIKTRQEQSTLMGDSLTAINTQTEITTAGMANIDRIMKKRQEELQQKIANDKAAISIDEEKRQAFETNAMAVGGALNGLANLAGKNTAAGKALAIASATIDTFVGANKAIAQGGIAGKAAAVGIIATGLANVKTIASTKVPGQGNTATPRANATQFNIVGVGGDVGLASAIGNQQAQPVKAYVVGKDITSQQELDRQITTGASLGSGDD